jgi:hypothetical protein
MRNNPNRPISFTSQPPFILNNNQLQPPLIVNQNFRFQPQPLMTLIPQNSYNISNTVQLNPIIHQSRQFRPIMSPLPPQSMAPQQQIGPEQFNSWSNSHQNRIIRFDNSIRTTYTHDNNDFRHNPTQAVFKHGNFN